MLKNISCSQYTVQDNDTVLNCYCSSSALEIALYNSQQYLNNIITIRKKDSTANAITITPANGQTIDGDSSITISANGEYKTLKSVNGGWAVVDSNSSSLQYFGDVANGNYSSFESDGTLVFNGNATVWDDLRIEPAVRSSGGNNPTFEKWIDNGSGSSGIYLYSFTDEHSNDKEIHFTAQMPHSWKGNAIDLHVHWIPAASATNKKIKWACEYTWANIAGTFGNTTIITKDTNIQAETNLVAKKHYITAFDDITPTTSQNGLSSILIGRLYRNSIDQTNDTFTDKVGLLYIDIHFQIDTLGSRTEFSK